MVERLSHYYEFGPFRLLVTDRLLKCGDTVVSLPPKLIDTLILLVENKGHVLTKNELMEALWPDTFVEETSLTQNISLLRRALAENGGSQQYIETIPKRGYRFAAEVREVTGANAQPVVEEPADAASEAKPTDQQVLNTKPKTDHARRRRKTYALLVSGFLLLLAAILLNTFSRNRVASYAPPPNSIAVLPFKTIGEQTDSELLGLGMADAIILKLSRLNGTTVLPTSSVFRYSDRNADALAIAKELGVEAVLDGTVQRYDDRVRVTAQLVRSDGKTIWSEKFDQSQKDIFALQDSISEQMASAIGRQISSNSPTSVSKNHEAQLAYVTGLYFWTRRTKENLAKAIDYLQQAVQKDPQFGYAHALLADCYFLGSQYTYEMFSLSESLKRADEHATRALELDQSIAEAHTVKAGVLWNNGNLTDADREFRRAIELKPSHAASHLRYGYFLFGVQKVDEAFQEMKLAQQLDPVSPISNTAFAYMMFMKRDFDGSITFNKKALELQPETAAARFNLGLTYLHKGNHSEGLAEFEKLDPISPFYATQGRVLAYGRSGRFQEARRALAQLLRFKEKENIMPTDFAILYSAAGQKDIGFKYLQNMSFTPLAVTRLKFDPELDELRSDPRFAEILKRRGMVSP